MTDDLAVDLQPDEQAVYDELHALKLRTPPPTPKATPFSRRLLHPLDARRIAIPRCEHWVELLR